MDDFEKQLHDRLRKGEEVLPLGVESRLHAGRTQALNASGHHSFVHRLLWPVTGMAMASVMALVITLSPGHNEQQNTASLEPPASSQELDFYYWLAETQSLNGT